MSTGFITHSNSSDDREGGEVVVLDTGNIVGDVYLLEGGDITYSYKPVWVDTQKLAITPLIEI